MKGTTRGSGGVSAGSRARAPAENEFWCILELEKTPDRHKSIIFDISGRPRGPDKNSWRAGRMLDTPGLDGDPAGSKISRTTTLEFQDFSGVFQDLCTAVFHKFQGMEVSTL